MKNIILGMAAATALMFTSSTMAIPILSVGFDTGNDGVFDTVITDGDAADMDSAADGVAATLGGFATVDISTVDFNPFNLHMTAIQRDSGVERTVTYGATAQNLSLANLTSAYLEVGGSGFDSTSVSAYLDTSNAAFGTGTLIGTITGPSPLSFFSNDLVITDRDLFSLTLITTITNTNGSSSVDSDINIPEPSIIALFGLGLAGLGFAGRRRKAK